MKLVAAFLIILIAKISYCDKFYRESLFLFPKKLFIKPDKDLDEIFHSIGKYVTYKMVNDMKEILDQQNGKKDELFLQD